MPNFSDKLMGLLNDPRTMDIGMGLLSAGGPSFTPHNIGQDMASAYQYANSREGERAQLEMQRMQLNQQKKQQAARAQIGQIYANTQTPQQIGQGVAGQMGILGAGPGMLNPQTQAQYVRANQGLNAINNQRQQQLPGLLSEAYPEQYGAAQIKGLFGTPPKTSSDFNDLRQILGRDPTQAELAAGNAPSALEQARLDQIAEAMSRTALSDELSTAERQRDIRRRESGSDMGVSKIGEILDEIESTRGSIAQSGGLADMTAFGTSTLAGLQRMVGVDSSSSENIATSIQKLKKKYTELGTGIIPDAFMGSDSKMGAFSAQLPSVDLEVGANLSIMKTTLEGIISEEQIYNGREVDTPTIIKAREMLQRIDEINAPPPPPGTVRIQ
jgi:hypothetical protein